MRHFVWYMAQAGCTCRSLTNGTLTNNTFNGNSAYQSGGAVYDQDVTSNITDNTFSDNTAKTSAKSIYRQVLLVTRTLLMYARGPPLLSTGVVTALSAHAAGTCVLATWWTTLASPMMPALRTWWLLTRNQVRQCYVAIIDVGILLHSWPWKQQLRGLPRFKYTVSPPKDP